MPGLDALPQIIEFHLGDDATACGDLGGIAVKCGGMSGAMIEQFVRDAKRRARLLGRRIQRSDLVAILQSRSAMLDGATDCQPDADCGQQSK